jgi:hypothetical protein
VDGALATGDTLPASHRRSGGQCGPACTGESARTVPSKPSAHWSFVVAGEAGRGGIRTRLSRSAAAA